MKNPPYFNRTQQGIILLLGTALLLLWAWRANFFLAPSPPPATLVPHVFVEVRGAVPHPGVYGFPQPPTLAEVFHKAGASGSVPAPPAREQKLSSGGLVEIGTNGQPKIGRMAGPQLLTLGLALDLNTATAADLDALPGIGPALAQRIIDYRQAHGPFKKIDDLIEVSGIGLQNLQKLKPYLSLGSPEAITPPGPEAVMATGNPVSQTQLETGGAKERRPGSKRDAKPKPPARPLDPNLATQADLETLPGIGPVLAQRIIDYRQAHGPFKKIDDLLEVSGIGPKKLEKFKPYLIISGQKGSSPAEN